MIKCPICNGDKFEIHSVGGLEMVSGVYSMLQNASKYFTCVQCEYVIAQPSDIDAPDEIVVYVLGNSLSKQRQGMNKIMGEASSPAPIIGVRMLQEKGYFGISNPDGTPRKDGPWIFTKESWKEYQANPKFDLGEGRYVIKIEEMF